VPAHAEQLSLTGADDVTLSSRQGEQLGTRVDASKHSRSVLALASRAAVIHKPTRTLLRCAA